MMYQSMIHKRNIDKMDFIKLKNFLSVKDPVKRIKKKNNYKPHILHKGLTSRIYKELGCLGDSVG